MRFQWVFIIASLASSPAIAATDTSSMESTIAACAKIEDGAKRLSCFDNLSKSGQAVDPPTPQKSNWEVKKETSKINDSTNVFLYLESDNEFEGKYGSAAHGNITIACREGKTDFYITMGNHFLADNQDYGRITMRVDKNKARQISMKASTDYGALGLWNGSATKFIKSLFGSSKLLARVTPFNESSLDAEFTISGIEVAIAPLRSACKW